MKTPQERLREWAHFVRDHNCSVFLPKVEDIEAVLAMLPPEPSPVCAGHNPDRLTEEQVDVKNGWRLLTEAEICDYVSLIQWNIGIDVWYGNGPDFTYRTKCPPGYFLSKPKQRVPLTAEDLPTVCWIGDENQMQLVTRIVKSGVYLPDRYLSFEDLINAGFQYSSDRKTRHPCYKEVETT